MKHIDLDDYKEYPKQVSSALIGFSCGIGWKPLVDKLMVFLHENGGCIVQLKEKFGILRVYVNATSDKQDETDEFVRAIESESAKICEACGTRENVTREGSWLKTLCCNCRRSLFKE